MAHREDQAINTDESAGGAYQIREMIKTMFSKIFVVYSCFFVLSGCIYNEEPIPEIVYTGNSKLVLPSPPIPTRTWTDVDKNIPRNWLPPSEVERTWTGIVIHHSATRKGSTAVFNKWHMTDKHWNGIGYDFVIGNGNGSVDGEVEVTFRWRRQIAGAHCGGTPRNWANEQGIGICLVGDFTRTSPSRRQMQSLVRLIRFLQKRYNIPKSRIFGHRSTPGYPGVTACPGRHFPMARLKSMLDS